MIAQPLPVQVLTYVCGVLQYNARLTVNTAQPLAHSHHCGIADQPIQVNSKGQEDPIQFCCSVQTLVLRACSVGRRGARTGQQGVHISTVYHAFHCQHHCSTVAPHNSGQVQNGTSERSQDSHICTVCCTSHTDTDRRTDRETEGHFYKWFKNRPSMPCTKLTLAFL